LRTVITEVTTPSTVVTPVVAADEALATLVGSERDVELEETLLKNFVAFMRKQIVVRAPQRRTVL